MGIWWADDKRFYYATVVAYNDADGKYEVLYDDDGVKEWLDFRKEKIHWCQLPKRSTSKAAAINNSLRQ